MEELKVHRWCDACHSEEGSFTEAAERFGITIDSKDGRASQPRTLDCCERHAGPVRELQALVRKAGAAAIPKALAPRGQSPFRPTPVPAAKPVNRGGYPPDATLACPLCAKVMLRSTMISHLQAKHGRLPITQPAKCPDCGERRDPKSMHAHRIKKHGYNLTDEMMAKAGGGS